MLMTAEQKLIYDLLDTVPESLWKYVAGSVKQAKAVEQPATIDQFVRECKEQIEDSERSILAELPDSMVASIKTSKAFWQDIDKRNTMRRALGDRLYNAIKLFPCDC